MAAQKSKLDKLYPRKAKASKGENQDTELLKTARERARDGATYWQENWEAGKDDLNFLAGEQWPSGVKSERELEQRPCLTNNVLPTFVDQILGDQRQNKPSIKVSATQPTLVPKDEGEDKETLKISNLDGNKDYEIAEVLQGIIRNIEYNCNAEDAYDISFKAAVSSGFSYLRLRSDYVSDNSFEQELIIEAIENQFAVTMDPGAKKPLREDANWVLIDDFMLKDVFQKKYPNATAEPLDGTEDYSGAWFSEKTVRVSEYFTREEVVREKLLMSDGSALWKDEAEKIVDELFEKGISIVRTRKVKTHKVMWRKISGYDVLEGPIEIKCSSIPVVPVWGKSITIKQRKIYLSAIRYSKDAQRMANYWDSAATETVALAPKAPFVGSAEHIEGYEDEWQNANTSNQAILPFNPQYQGDTGPRRQPPALMPSAEITLGLNSIDKIKSTMGMFDASIGAKGNETSGKAIMARQRESDVGSFEFYDNLTKAIRQIGKLMVQLIPVVSDTERVHRMKFFDETEDFVKINQKVYDEETDTWVKINDISVGEYDVVVSTGPAFTTQRMEAAESMIQFAQAVPAAAGVMADLIAQNMDWPGADVISERLKKIVPPNVLTAEERKKIAEDEPEQDNGPTPEQELAAKDLEVKSKQADADFAKAEADQAQAQATALKAQLESEQAKAEMANIENQANNGNQAMQMVRELVAEALAEIMEKDAQ